MAELILIGLFIAYFQWIKRSEERKLDNYNMSKVDTLKLTHDMGNGVSLAERKRRLINGDYDKK